MRALLCITLSAAACATAPKPRYDFHSSPWLNLHLALYHDAVLRKLGRPAPPHPELAGWDAAVGAYFTTHIEHDLLFDEGMVKRGLDLVAHEGDEHITDPVLDSAMPAYRARRWPDDDAKNRAYIAKMAPEVERLAPQVIPDLERLYGATWPAAPIRTDITNYAGRVGAYTTLEPTHITIVASSSDVEIPFHEASHALVGALEDALAAELAAQQKEAPDLWHAVLFYTTGDVLRRHRPGHVPYADANGLWTRGDWPAYKRALDAAWKPYLDGKTSRAEAISALVTYFKKP